MQTYLGWVVGLVALIVFGAFFWHGRQQAQRLTDRTRELERLSTELIRANRAKSEFLANVSHELRTPLNAIVGFVEMLRDGVYGELAQAQRSPVERIEASANHLRHLVGQVLDLAKIAAGRVGIQIEKMDLRSFVLDVASEVEPLVAEKHLHISLALGPSIPLIDTDPTYIRQILVNLIGNAIKYSSEGTIVIRLRSVPKSDRTIPQHLRKPLTQLKLPQAETATPKAATTKTVTPPQLTDWIALQVADSGIGVAPADHERIFNEFERVDPTPFRDPSDSATYSTGLGLSISRRLARLLDGDITIESELGKGATFTLWLPVVGS